MQFSNVRSGSYRLSSGLLVLCLGILLLSLCTAPAWSQATSSGNLSGLVKDEKGAAVPGAEVKLTDPETGNAQATRTNVNGRYSFPQVEGGTYTFTVTKERFSVFRIPAQELRVGNSMTIDAVLKAGSTTTFVDAAPVAAGSSGGSSSAVDAKSLTAAPTLGNEAASLAVLAAGTDSTGNTAGAFSDQNAFLLDGGSNTDDFSGNTNPTYAVNWAGTGGVQTNGSPAGIVPTSVESVEQIRTTPFGQGADAANSIGGQTQMATRHGTNTYHGAAYGSYFGSNWGGANTWANNHTPSTQLHTPSTPLVVTHRSRFGGSLGGVLLPKMAGGKTYFFVNYEGSRFPNGYTYQASDPSVLLRAGVIQVANSAGVYMPYNLNASPVTVNGQTYQPAMCGTGLCDPRGIGISPTVKQIWNMMPLPNEFLTTGDQYNAQGFQGPIAAPLTQNSYVARIDHQFTPKERFFGSYRYTNIGNVSASQTDMGGVFPGDKLGQFAAIYHKPQHPSIMVYGLTSNLRPNLTNDLRFSYTRNQFQWAGVGQPPQFAGLGGNVEIGGETTTPLSPFNVNENNTRQRIFDGLDKFLKDDISWLRGKHMVQIGGSWMHMNGTLWRDDNPQGISSHVVYQVTSANTNFQGFPYPSTVPANQQTNWNTYYAYALGMVSQSQLNVLRDSSLKVLPAGSTSFAKLSTNIESYNVYLSDSWRAKPSLTFVYGIGWMTQMPPHAVDGVQVGLVDQSGKQVIASQYLAQRQQAALAGQAWQPMLAWAIVPDMAGHPKYPYDPFYGGVSPRFSVAWNPRFNDGILGALTGHGKTVLRAGYAIMYGRINPVAMFAGSENGVGMMQTITCPGPTAAGTCLGSNGVTPSTVFRIGPDGLTVPLPSAAQVLARPYTPGVNGNPASADNGLLDPNMRPESSQNFNLTLSRQVTNAVSLDIGYVGRIIRHEMLPRNLDAVPYMTTLGGQTFASAYANTYWNMNGLPTTLPAGTALPAQPFFETALGGAGSAYCQGYANCTTAVGSKNSTAIRNTAVSDLWTAMYNAPSWILGRDMLSQPLGPGQPSQGYSFVPNTMDGFSNYNGLVANVRLRDYHGFSGSTAFTWGRALGTPVQRQSAASANVLDVFNLQHDYGVQPFDLKFMYNFRLTYSPKAFAKQKGVVGHVLGGWSFAPIFMAQSGTPIAVTYSEGGCTGCQAFGEVSTASSGYKSISTNAQAIAPIPTSTSATYNNFGSNGAGTNNPTGVNIFSNPAAVVGDFRKCVLGYDSSCAGYSMRVLPYWNMDLGIRKGIKTWKESAGAELRVNYTNLFNHPQAGNPTLTVTTPTTFGRITSVLNAPRQLQVGLRLYF